MTGNRIAVVGSRDFNDYPLVCRILDPLLSGKVLDKIISGGAKGADSLAEKYADAHGVEKEIIYADWDGYGKAAGPIRNQQMVDHCDRVIAFWDGKSRGTLDMITRATISRKVVLIVPVGYFVGSGEKATTPKPVLPKKQQASSNP